MAPRIITAMHFSRKETRSSPMERLTNYLRRKGDKDGGFTLEDDKIILEFIMDPKWEGKLRGPKVWEKLKEKEFHFMKRIMWSDLKNRAHKLLRQSREHRAWIALTGLKDSRWVDETRSEYEYFEVSMRYLRYHCLSSSEKSRPPTPFTPPEPIIIESYQRCCTNDPPLPPLDFNADKEESTKQ